jgi:hypothetical protein
MAIYSLAQRTTVTTIAGACSQFEPSLVTT